MYEYDKLPDANPRITGGTAVMGPASTWPKLTVYVFL